MTKEEQALLKQAVENKKPCLIPDKEYSDEFYNAVLKSFVPKKKIPKGYLLVKRLLDLLVSLVALIILAIPFLVIAIVIKLDNEGSVFFISRRVGQYNKTINCLKFRSMATEAPTEEATSSFKDSQNYITKVGHFLRKTSIDELPQLINVLTGKMSIIGYRPLVRTEVEANNMRNTLGVFRMKPGISGYSQINGRDLVYYKNKAIMDAYYVNNVSLLMDLKLTCKTISVVLKREGNEDK